MSCTWQLETNNAVLHCQPLQSCVELRVVLKAVQLLGLATCIIECYPVAESCVTFNPYPTVFPYGNGVVLHFYQQQESSTTKTVHKVINKGLKTYV